ncbi:hemerythrin domain-containing protein [Amycolatopsis rhabdoformis]|uniref:Hemerythrin domain-containing protein n=1 Tax=Amycolatopsis rhabdoformis TaxID=1448059 RepID=A0ABZ1HWZ8_9PSEU|nr:hemerythrin domain-containing protein [Amycolatopsis rhabdoformis]WSE26670.1 hemerythrin domain-containing protein [Amycolatopsis rhabdoformis]
MSEALTDAVAVVETRMVHELHRRATTLLTEAAARPEVALPALAELRDFLVQNLHHHHQTEDDELWPLITAVAPDAGKGLVGLEGEHDELDRKLDALAAVPLESDAHRGSLREAAAAVRDLVHLHLEHEEPVLFPALREHLPAETWATFSQHVIDTAPPIAPHLMVGFLDQAGTPEEVDLVLSGLPAPVRPMLPALRQQGEQALLALAGTGAPA